MLYSMSASTSVLHYFSSFFIFYSAYFYSFLSADTIISMSTKPVDKTVDEEAQKVESRRGGESRDETNSR